VLIVCIGALALFPIIGEDYYAELVVRLMILGIFAMSLDFLIGYTGLVSFGHAAFFGLTGYILAILTPDSGPITFWYALSICLLVSAFAALVIGWFSVRTTGIYFIMITLAFAQMLFYYFNENTELGGSDGIFIFYRPEMRIGDWTLLDINDAHVFYYLVLGSLIGAYVLLSIILRAPFGQVIQSIKANEARTKALGYATVRYKLVSFVIAGTLAGFAGFLEATHTGIVSPGHLGWHESGNAIMIVILGGMGTLYGAVIGAFTFGFLQDSLQEMSEHWHLWFGLFVIFVVLFLPHGIAGLINSLSERLRGKTTQPETAKPGTTGEGEQ
jgi:branched-chain amino acid transport system permease protein